MERSELYMVVRDSLLVELAKIGDKNVPVSILNRHIFLSRADVIKLFGAGYQLRPVKEMSQSGQFACEEKITLIGPGGTIADVRVIGPECQQTQVAVSFTDAQQLGIKPIVRMPGSLLGTPGIRVSGPAGIISLHSGVIIPARHMHMSEEQAAAYQLKDGDTVKIRKKGMQSAAFDDVIVCTGKNQRIEVHFNTDDGTSAGIICGEIVEII
ncbi:MAG: PduL/EutD family phosphate acyltransferase [Eubacteriales bacterium]